MRILKKPENYIYDTVTKDRNYNYDRKRGEPLHHNHNLTDYEFLKQQGYKEGDSILANFGNSYYEVLPPIPNVVDFRDRGPTG